MLICTALITPFFALRLSVCKHRSRASRCDKAKDQNGAHFDHDKGPSDFQTILMSAYKACLHIAPLRVRHVHRMVVILKRIQMHHTLEWPGKCQHQRANDNSEPTNIAVDL